MESQRIVQEQVFSSLVQKSESIFLPVLIDIYHPSIVWGTGDVLQEDGHLRLVNDVRSMKYRGDENEPKLFTSCSFDYKPPKEDGKKKNTASISVSCIDSRMIEVIRSVPEGLKCKVVAFYSKITDSNGKVKYIFQKMNSAEFSMFSCTWDGITASWTLDPDETLEYSVPRDVSSPFRVPAIMEGK